MTEGFVEVNGCRTWTAVDGDGPPVVLLHGGPGVCDYLAPVASMLADRYAVHRYEQRGCGRTAATAPLDVATLVADLDTLRAHWGHDRVRLIGHSWGAALAFMYATEHADRVERLVLWCGVGITDGWQPRHREAVAARLTPEELARMDELRDLRLAGAPDPDGSLDREGMRLLALSDLADRRNERLLPVPLFAYPTNWSVSRAVNADWRIPTVVWGAAGDPRPPEPAEHLASLIPHATYERSPGAGHLPWVERPDAVEARLRELLA
jgi:proline iminopeptidase